MKPGDMVALRHDRVIVQLLSDSLEKRTNLKKLVFAPDDSKSFRRGQTAIVVEINQKNLARVKVFYDSGTWWGNISDMLVIG